MSCMHVLYSRKTTCNSSWQTPTHRKYTHFQGKKEVFKPHMCHFWKWFAAFINFLHLAVTYSSRLVGSIRKWKWESLSHVRSLWPHGLCPWDSPGQYTGVSSCSLLQWILPTQESNRGLLHCRQILYQLSYQASPWYREVLPFSFVNPTLQFRKKQFGSFQSLFWRCWPKQFTLCSLTYWNWGRNESFIMSHEGHDQTLAI